MTEKLERNGMVGVLVSPGFGAGWSTWNEKFGEAVCMDAEIVQAVEAGDKMKAVELAVQKFGHAFYSGGAAALIVEWVSKGTVFEITEYDGAESLRIITADSFMKA